MKNMKRLLLLVLIILSMFLVGCSRYDDGEYQNGDETAELQPLNSANRKIIYSVSGNLEVDDLEATLVLLKQNLNSDEWVDEETVSDDYAFIVIRIESVRLNDYVAIIRGISPLKNYSMKSTDVSLTYQDKSSTLNAYLAEKTRLVELMENATMSEILTINQRISKIDLEVGKLQGELNEYDSLIDYSKITLRIYRNNEGPFRSFGTRISSAFYGGWSAVGLFFEGLLIVIVALFPFAVVFGPIIGGTIFFYKRSKKKKQQKENKS